MIFSLVKTKVPVRKFHRKLEHRDHPRNHELAGSSKTIYGLLDPREILPGCKH